MKMFFVIDKDSRIKCTADNPLNLHGCDEAKGDRVIETDLSKYDYNSFYPGDVIDIEKKTITSHPELYPPEPQEAIDERKIQAEIRRLAVASLKAKGELPTSFVDPKIKIEEIKNE